MNPENQDLLKSMERSLRTTTKLLKWLLAIKIILIVILIVLYCRFPALLDKIEVVVQCDEIVFKEKLVGFTIIPYTPKCTIDFKFDD